MNFESDKLSFEQEFTHKVFVEKIQALSYEETKELLIKFHKHTLFKDNHYKKLFHRQGRKVLEKFREQNNQGQ